MQSQELGCAVKTWFLHALCVMVKHLVECLGPSVPSPSVSFIFHDLSSTSKLVSSIAPTPPPHRHSLRQSAHTVNCDDSLCQGWSVNLQPPQRAVWYCLLSCQNLKCLFSSDLAATPVGPSTTDALTKGPAVPLLRQRNSVRHGTRLVSGSVSKLGNAKLQPNKPPAGQCLLYALYE